MGFFKFLIFSFKIYLSNIIFHTSLTYFFKYISNFPIFFFTHNAISFFLSSSLSEKQFSLFMD